MGVCKKYKMEIGSIIDKLDEICNERYYERGTGECKASTIAKNIKSEFIRLIDKIENNKESVGEEVNRILSKK
nr:hypothetical protein [uncultured Cellulosilyticum sp.]